MAGHKGNKNAEKWTLEKARKLSVKANKVVDSNTFFVSTIAVKVGVYRELFHYLMNKFNDDEIVFNNLKMMFTKCESIIWEKAANREIDKSIATFALKAIHGLFESSHQTITEIKQDEPKTIDYSKLDNDELIALKKIQDKLEE